MTSGDKALTIFLELLAAVIICFVLVIGIVTAHDSDNDSRVKKACIDSGQQWYHDNNGWATCGKKP